MRDRSSRSVMLAVALGAAVVATSVLPPRAFAADAEYGFSVGGMGSDFGADIAVDPAGNVYVAGGFNSKADLDPGPLQLNVSSNGGADAFVASYGPGGGIRWAFGFGGGGPESAHDVVVKGAYVYVVGQFSSTVDFDPAPTLKRRTSQGGYDGFILRLHRDTGAFSWVGTIGGPQDDDVMAITVDDAGRMIIAGYFYVTADLDPTAGVVNRTSAGFNDAFIARLDTNGTLIWARRVGGMDIDIATGVVQDGSGDVFVAGHFTLTVDFDPGAAVANRTSNGAHDPFVLKLTSGGAYVWARSVGGGLSDFGKSLGVSAAGTPYLAGLFQGTVDFDPGPGVQNRTSNGSYDVYVLKLSVGGAFAWVATAGSAGPENANHARLAPGGRFYVTGTFYGTTDFDPSGATANLTPAGDGDVFVWRLAAAGGYQDAWRMGGLSMDWGYGVDVLDTNVYTTGLFDGSGDYDPDAGTLTLTSAGSNDGYVSRVSE